MSKTIETRVTRLTAGTVFRLVGVGLVCSMVPFSLLMGVFALFGAETVEWDGKPITGINGLLLSPAIGLFISAIFTLIMGTAIAIGLWIYSFFSPLEISYRELD